jgi:hypothetical protein
MANVLDMSGDALPNLHQWLPLLSESLAHQGRFRWQMRGASMLPTLPPDCEIEIVPPPAAIPLGALVVFAGNASLVVHRLVHRTPSRLLTQGDNRRGPDAWLQPSQVLGVVVAAYYDTRRIWPRAAEPVLRWWWIGRADGMWLLRRSKRLLFRR